MTVLEFASVVDPAFNLQTTTAATAWLATAGRLAGGDFPPTVVVGVGSPSDDLAELMARRVRDVPPTEGGAPEGLSLPPFRLGLGGAARFLDALVSEVMPQVEARHSADPADRTLVGHSFGGLFALFTLLDRPAAFGRYLLISPSIWWDDRVILRREQDWADRHADLPARLFIAVGRDEQAPGGWKNESFPDEAIAAVRHLDNCRELCNSWRAGATRVSPWSRPSSTGEYHLTVEPPLSRAG